MPESDTKVRVADLNPGDLTQHAGGSCECHDRFAPWRVEKLEPLDDYGVWVTWAHPPCGVVAQPTPCHIDCLVSFFGREAW